ncbi:MAG: hypothetical protein MI919_33745, partial [Holophagales bacterium]|nr:hypothetical protein [Holophagales bacterium]
MSERPESPRASGAPPEPTSMEGVGELDSLLRELYATTPAETEEPWPEELLAFVRGDLDGEARDRLILGLADHPVAMDLLLELRHAESGTSDPENAPHPDEQRARAETVMAATTVESTSTPGSPGLRRGSPAAAQTGMPSLPRPEPLPRRTSGRTWAAAASLTLASTLFALFQLQEAERLRHEMAELRESAAAAAPAPGAVQGVDRPESSAEGGGEEREEGETGDDPARAVVTGVPILDLFSTEHLRGEAGVAASVEAAGVLSAELVTLVLTPSDPVPERAYHLQILDPRGEEVWGGTATADPS